MKLTLRTLLAYLDDRLSPANARELGQKLAKSPFATELAERIKDVVRRRRLANDPAQPHKTIDANLIAEYLDDQLTPELVALIEKEILASDYSLAEVAASHQILGLLSDPVEIDDGLRDRLYKLDPAIASEASDDTTPHGDPGMKPGEWQPLERQSENPQRSPMILLVAMVLGWLVLLATDSSLFQNRGPDTALADADNEKIAAKGVIGAAADNQPRSEADSDGTVKEPAAKPATTDSSPADMDVAAATDSNERTPDPPVPAIPDTVKAGGNVPAGAAAETAANSEQPVAAADTAASSVVASDNIPPPKTPTSQHIELVDQHGMVVVDDQPNATWLWAADLKIEPTASWLKELSGRYAGISEPFMARVVAPNAGWSLQILGTSVFRVNDEPSPGIQLVEGRLLLRSYATEEPGTFRLWAGRRSLDISIPAKNEVVAVEVMPLPVPVGEPGALADDASLLPLENACILGISAVESEVQIITSDLDLPLTIPRGTVWLWNTTSDIMTEGAQTQSNMIPEWVFAAKLPPTDLNRALVEETAAACQTSESVTGSALALMEHRNPQIAAYAVQQLTMIRSVDDLVSTLLQTEGQLTRQTAIAGLQKLVRETHNSAGRIIAALSTRLPEIELENAMKLIAGVTPTAAEDRRTSEWLVGMLENSRVALRALAIFNLEQLTAERNGFFANDDSGRREAAVRRWKRLLDRNDGRLIVPVE